MIKKASYSLIKMESCLCQLSMIIIIKCKDSFLFVISLTVILFVRQKKVHSVNEYSKMQKKFDSILPSLKAFFLKFILPELLTNSIKSGLLAESPSTSCGVQQPSISCSNNYDDVLEQEAEFYQSRISSENDDVPYCICKQCI